MADSPNPEKSLRICKKCLIRDMDQKEYFKNMYDYIEHLNPDIKTPAAEYEHRLQLCKDCEELQNGMCRVCGCFVEMRAAAAKNYCPAIKPKW